MNTLYEMTMLAVEANRVEEGTWLKSWAFAQEWIREIDNIISGITYPDFHHTMSVDDKIVLGAIEGVLFISHTPNGYDEEGESFSYAIPMYILRAKDPSTEAFRDRLQRTIKYATSMIEHHEAEIQSFRAQVEEARNMLESMGVIHEQTV